MSGTSSRKAGGAELKKPKPLPTSYFRTVEKKKPVRRRKRRSRRGRISPLWVVIPLAVIAVCIIWPLFLRNRSSERGPEVPDGNWRFGIDISHNNRGPILWDSLAVMVDRSGRLVKDLEAAKEVRPVDFVFIKATEGLSMKDKDFKENWKSAGKSGIQRGAYHFFRSGRDPEVQAENFCRTVGKLGAGDLPPVLDVETMHRGCTAEMLNERVLVWLKTVGERYGRKPIVYAPESYVEKILSPEITEHYPLWIAHYKVDSLESEGWRYWQFTDRAIVRGVPEPVDLSVTPRK
jgi:lysozyme